MPRKLSICLSLIIKMQGQNYNMKVANISFEMWLFIKLGTTVTNQNHIHE